MPHSMADVDAVRATIGTMSLQGLPITERVAFVRAWLDGAMILRVAELPATLATMAGVLAAGQRSFASDYAMVLLALAARPENDDDRG